MSVTKLLAISLGAILTNNFIFSQFLGICPFLGVSKKSDTAVGMGLAVTFVMGLASAFCYGVNIILVKLGLDYMQTVAFILVVAEPRAVHRDVPQKVHADALHGPRRVPAADHHQLRRSRRGAAQRAERLQLHRDPWCTASPAALASCWRSTCSPAVRERLEFADYPKAFEGFPIALITAGLIALAFMGFSGLQVWPM